MYNWLHISINMCELLYFGGLEMPYLFALLMVSNISYFTFNLIEQYAF